MIDLYTSPTPNGWKAAMVLEELSLDYTVKNVDLAAGDQHEPPFLKMNPNGRIPVIVDHDADGLIIFDSNAIQKARLIYLSKYCPSSFKISKKDSCFGQYLYYYSALYKHK